MNHVTKNLNLTLLAWLLCTLVAPACFAAGGDHGPGNGGDVVVCRNAAGAIRSVELLDLYEGRTRWGNVADLGGPGLSVPEKVSLLLTRLGNRLPAFEKLYRDWYATFEQETLSLSGVELVDIPDSEHIALPVGCAIEQIAIQKEPQFPREKRYTINQDLWNASNADTRAALIVHELMYRLGIKGGADNSVTTRYLNSLLASNQLQGLSICELIDIMSRGAWLGAVRSEIALPSGIVAKLWSVDCDKDGVILSASMANGPQPVPGADRELVIRDIDSTITFYPSGRISVIRLSGNYFDPLDPRVNKFHFQFPAGSVVAIGASYSEQGTIESVFASEETPLVTSNGKTVRCLPKRLISLTNEGYLRGCYGFTSDPVRLWNHDFVLESKEASWWTFDGAVLTTDYLSERPDFKVSLNGVWVAGRYLNQSDDKTWSGAYMDGFSLNIQGQVLTFIPFSTITSFWLNGGLAIGSLASAQSFTLQVGNRKVEFTSTVECGFFSRYRYVTSLSLHENGAVKEATLARDATFVSKDGRQVVVKKYSDVSFDPDGNFLKETPANCI